ncbi:hypothetical protein OH77DRAFT_1523842 [Trametes cingulata]|nr:hypothetical protein OH77DRAFT_1523842 [Trametes cingulata]
MHASLPDPQKPKRRKQIVWNQGWSATFPGLLIKHHSYKAKLPTRGSALAAGYDLYIAKTLAKLVDTHKSVAVPAGTYRPTAASRLAVDFPMQPLCASTKMESAPPLSPCVEYNLSDQGEAPKHRK